jgi:energy-coupling factor transporter ATP-binding protein EcfA2
MIKLFQQLKGALQMLIKLELENFLSFKELTTFDFAATKYEILESQNQIDDILKGALFIGPNASGKSNALRAIRLLLSLMYGDKEVNLSEYHCVFSMEQDVKIKYYFQIKNSIIVYEIKHNIENNMLTELLQCDVDRIIINRIGTEGIFELDKKICKSDLSNNKIFLRGLDLGDAFSNDDLFKEFINFLSNSYYFDMILQTAAGKGLDTIRKTYMETKYKDDLNAFFEEYNLGFNVEYSESSQGEGVLVKATDTDGNPITDFFWKRTGFPIPIYWKKESLGNKILFTIMSLIFLVAQRGGMLILDEFSSGLHNRLEELIIRYFMKNSNHAQLFLTSHDSNLISNYIMRPDQIYIVEFKDNRGSVIKRVSDYRPREAQNLEKMYLSGVFEGLPEYEKV